METELYLPELDDSGLPLEEAAVQAVLDTGDTVKGWMLLAPAAASHQGPETPYDVLNGDEAFVELLLRQAKLLGTSEKRRRVWVNKRAVVELCLDKPPVSDLERISDRQEVTVRYDIGKEIKGEILFYDLPPSHGDLEHFLNAKERFFHLYTGETDHLINKDHVRQVMKGKS